MTAGRSTPTDMLTTAYKLIRVVSGLLLIWLAAVSCTSSQEGRNHLRVFFDGVPPESYYVARTNASGLSGPSSNQTTGTVRQAGSPSIVVHAPYEAKECHSCHETETGQTFATITNLCFKCHDNFPTSMRFQHKPVGSGDCLRCHTPHTSFVKGLLVKPQTELCSECHQLIRTPAPFVHRPVADGDCVSCHDPHVSNQAGLLKNTMEKVCLGCHVGFYEIPVLSAAAPAPDAASNRLDEATSRLHGDSAIATATGPATPATRQIPVSLNESSTNSLDWRTFLRRKNTSVPATVSARTNRNGNAALGSTGANSAPEVTRSVGKPSQKTADATPSASAAGKRVMAKYKHAPVEAGECTSCHDPHKSGNASLLKKPLEQICFECHDKSDIENNAKHPAQRTDLCTKCHDPHRADNPALLRFSSQTTSPRATK